MSVPKGYKRTEVGVIPEEWVVRPLGSLLQKGRLGGNYPNQNVPTDFPLMKMGNITRGQMDVADYEFIKAGCIPDEQHRLHRGDVLFNTRNTLELVGKVGIWRDELPVAYYNSNLMRLEFDESQVCSNEYACAALNTAKSIARLRELATGTTSVAAIYTRDLVLLPFVVPPLPEQRAIAAALGDVDALLAALDAQIVKQRDLKQATMQQLLTGQTRLPGFTGKWETKRLRDVACLNRNNVIPRQYPTRQFAHFSLPAFDAGNGPVIEQGSSIESSKFSVPENAVLVSKLNPRIPRVWAPASIPTNAVASTEFLVLTPLLGMHRGFLHVLCTSPDFCEMMELSATGTTGSHQRISPGTALGIEIQVPQTESEQAAIADNLSDFDAILAALASRRAKTAALKQAMMQSLLTGRIRLV